TAENRRELDADGAAAQDGDRLGDASQVDRFVARDDPLAVDFDPRHAARGRSGCDDDFLAGMEGLLLALEDVDISAAGQARSPFDPVDFVLPEQELDALRQAA